MKCKFCNESLESRSISNEVFQYFTCHTCLVNYRQLQHRSVLCMIQFITCIDGEHVAISIFPDDNLTTISFISKAVVEPIQFPFVLQGITPDNVLDKVRTLLVFS